MLLLLRLVLPAYLPAAAAPTAGGAQLPRGYQEQVAAAVQDGVKRLLRPSVEREVRAALTEAAAASAAATFGANLGALLLQVGSRSDPASISCWGASCASYVAFPHPSLICPAIGTYGHILAGQCCSPVFLVGVLRVPGL